MTNRIERDYLSLRKAVNGIKKSLKTPNGLEDAFKRLDTLDERLSTQSDAMTKFSSIANRTKYAYDALLLRALQEKQFPEDLVFDLAKIPDPSKISDTLNKMGICIIRDDKIVDLCINARHEMKYFLSNAQEHISQGAYVELDDVIIDGGCEIPGGHTGRAEQKKAVVNVRKGFDEGLVDVFNADRIIPSLAEIKHQLANGYIMDIINRAIPNMVLENINVYINNGVTSTRGFHYDSRAPVIKIFILLTDVPDHSYGPYCYELGSHLNEEVIDESFAGIAFTSLRKNDAYFVDYKKVVACLGKVGDVIISYQHGSHRGFPQSPDRRRMMGVQVLRPKKD